MVGGAWRNGAVGEQLRFVPSARATRWMNVRLADWQFVMAALSWPAFDPADGIGRLRAMLVRHWP